ncbi:MAG: Calx-beta domain-containing protein, partial [Planctomycetaceae bacterium]
TLSAASTRTITVEVSTVDQTATAGTDFTGITNQLVTFTPGQTVQTVEVSIIGDTAIEQEEFFEVVLTNASNASILDGIGQGNIQDNDNPGPTSTIGVNFQGTDSTQIGFTPPDTMGAVGPDHIVELLNGRFAVYDKLTGAEITSSNSDQFVTANGGVIPAGQSVFDPRIVYDQDSGRWFAAFIDALTPANTIYVMVSTSSDPTMPWQTVQFIGDTVASNRFNDYETLSVDADGVYLGTNNFVNNGGFDVSLYSIPKADLLAATPTIANLSRFENLNAGMFGSTPQPALDFGPSDGVAAFFSASGSGRITRTDISGATGPGAVLGTPIDITVPAYTGAPPGDQPGGVTPLENVSPRFGGNVVEVGSSFWMTHAVLDMGTGNSAVRWYEIDENTNALLQTGTIVDPALDFLDPSIAVNDTGSVVIGYTGTGPAQSPSSYASIGQTTAGVTTFTPPTLLQQGTGTYVAAGGRNRWGDYSATVLDPANPAAFWTFQQLTIGNNDFAVQITNVNIGAPPPPTPMPPPATTGVGYTIDGGDGNDN